MTDKDESLRATRTIRSTRRALLGEAGATYEGPVAPDEELNFEVRVPDNDSDTAAGALVYISPNASGAMPHEWASVLDTLNLVWVGANESGNEIVVARRAALALMGREVAALAGPVDRSRIYLSGFSGGGRVASMMVLLYPTEFSGGLFICGANASGPAPDDQARLIAPLRFVFLTGTDDFNCADTEFAYGSFVAAGLGEPTLTVIDGLEHGLPGATDFRSALQVLDGPVRR